MTTNIIVQDSTTKHIKCILNCTHHAAVNILSINHLLCFKEDINMFDIINRSNTIVYFESKNDNISLYHIDSIDTTGSLDDLLSGSKLF